MPSSLAFPPPAPLPDLSDPARRPRAVAGYELVRRLGVSEASEVVLAVARGPLGFERTVVLKRLLPETTGDDGALGNARLAREALAYARLAHPAIVRLYDFVEDAGRLTLVLEHVDGVSLRRILDVAPVLDTACVWYIGYRIFLALSAAHAARDPMTREFAPVIHRDVSPGNVLVPWEGYVKLADFGIARLAGVAGDTRPGVVKGTVGYLAPEQVRGEAISVRTDVYGACLVMRELLLGAPVFPRGERSELQLLDAMASPDLVPLAALRPGLPVHVTDAIDRALAPDPDLRSVTAEEMVTLLRSVVDLEGAREMLVEAISKLRRGEEPLARSAGYATRPDAGASLFDESTRDLEAATDTAPTYARLRDSQEAITSRPPAAPVTSMVMPRAQIVRRPMSASHPPLAPKRPSPMPSAILDIVAPAPRTPRMGAGPGVTTAPMAAAPITAPLPMASWPPPPPSRAGFAFRTSAALVFETPNAMTTPLAPEVAPGPGPARPRRRTRGPGLLFAGAAVAIAMGIAIGGVMGLQERVKAKENAEANARENANANASASAEANANASAEANANAKAKAKANANANANANASATANVRGSSPAQAPAPAPAPASASSGAPAAAPAPASAPASSGAPGAPAATTGRLITDPSEAGHRIFVDGRLAGAGGAPLVVRCGRHDVRVGSAGRLRKVDVPCGGDLEVAR